MFCYAALGIKSQGYCTGLHPRLPHRTPGAHILKHLCVSGRPTLSCAMVAYPRTATAEGVEAKMLVPGLTLRSQKSRMSFLPRGREKTRTLKLTPNPLHSFRMFFRRTKNVERRETQEEARRQEPGGWGQAPGFQEKTYWTFGAPRALLYMCANI